MPCGTDDGDGSALPGAEGRGNGSGRTPLDAHALAVTIATTAMPAIARRFISPIIGTGAYFKKLK